MDGDLSIPSYFYSHVGAENFLVLEMKYLWGSLTKNSYPAYLISY